MTDTKRTADDRFARFKEHLRAQRLKSTAQRDTIVRAFLSNQRHVSVEELYTDVRHFRDGEARYESAEKKHHDHLICESCGKIVEFEEPRIERLQEDTARRLDFQFTGHKMELYGICRDCRKARHAAG